MTTIYPVQWDKQIEAYRQMRKAIQEGLLVRPSVCEICGLDVDEYNQAEHRVAHPNIFPKERIVGHHWRGYGFPLDVW